MFEGWVYQLVAGYLGNYIKDIHREQFRIGLWSGVALVENAELRLEAFDYLQLPFAIKKGFVGKLRLQIPWKTLFWEPIVIALENVEICACPRDESEFDVKASENRAMAAKKAKLAAAEITKLSSHVPDEKVRESFLSHVLAKFIANIQVTVRNIHINYVDDKESNFDFGAKLSGLTVCTDARGIAGGGKNKGNLAYKSVELNQFSIYWNSAKDTAKHDTEDNLNHILNPMDASAKLTVNRSAAIEGAGAQYALTVNMKKLDFNLANRQLYEMFLLLDSLKVSQLRERYGRFRPRARVTESVREWWVYAINAVRSDVEKRLRRTSWKYLGWRLECRHRYVALYTVKLESLLEGKPPDEEIVDCLEALEKELDMDMILSFRSLAEEKCELGASFAAKEDSKRSSEDANIRSRGWLSRFSFGMLGGSESMDAAAEVTGPFSDEIMKDLYEATNFHPTNPHPSGEWSKGYSLMTVTLQLREATAKLENSKTKRGLVEVRLGGICVGYRKQQGLSNAALAVKSFGVMDLFTTDTSFPCIVSQKALNTKQASSKHVSYAEVVYGGLFGISQRELSQAAFTIDIELSHGSSSKISVVVKPLEVVYMPHVISHLVDFFKLPAVREIDEGDTEYLKARAKLILTVVLKSPILLIPERTTSGDCAILIVAPESVRVKMSEVRGVKEIKEIKPTLPVDLPLNSKHFEISLTGLQIGIGKGTIDSSVNLPFWSALIDTFDIQTNILKYRDSLGIIHYEVDGKSGDLKVAVSAENCKTLMKLLSMVRVPVDDDNIRVSKPSSSIISAWYSIKTIDVQVHINDNQSAPLKAVLLHLDQLDLKFLSQGLERNMELSVASFYMDSMDHPKHSEHRRLFSMDSVFSMKYTLNDEGPSSEVVLHLQRLHGRIYPVMIRELTRFFGIFIQNEPEYSHETSLKLFTLRLQLDEMSFTFYRHPSERALATISLQKSSFILSSSDSISQSWQLEGNATELQLTGPEFATQEVDGIPYGNYGDKPSNFQLYLQKRADVMEMVINLETVKCILLTDYLAVIIGFIKSPDWTVQEQRAAKGESNKIVFQYTIDVKNSVLLLPTGGRSYTKVNIPEFRFSYIPPELSGSFRTCHPKVQEDVKIFYILGKQLSLSDMEYSSGRDSEYSLINCLDGEIIVEVPVSSHNQTTIHLVFPVIELLLFGKEFLAQIERVEMLSTDLAIVGKKSKHANSIWECLNSGKTFIMETTEVATPKEVQEKPTILFNCSIASFRVLVYSLEKDNLSHVWTTKKIMAGEVDYVSSLWCVKQGILDRFDMETTSMKFIDEGKKLVSTSSQLTVKTSALPDLRRKVSVLLPSVDVGLELASWSRIFSWIFLCFPVIPSPETADHVSLELFDSVDAGVRVIIEPEPPAGNLVLEVDIPHVSFFLPEYAPEREHTKMIWSTCSIRINSFEFSGNNCKFSACLSEIKAETLDEKACGDPCLLGGNIQVKGDVVISAHVAVDLFFVVDSIDCCCSYPVLQFLNEFKLEPSEEEDSLGLDIGVTSFCDITNASLLLTDGRWNYNCPLLELILSNSSLQLSWTIDSLQLMIASMIEISYHNIQKAVWEPFLEPWHFLINFMKTSNNTNLEVNSSSSLNINITEGLSQAVTRAVEMICWKSVDGVNNQEHFSQYAPYWFQNDTGTILAYTLLWPEGQSECECGESSNWCTLMPGCSVPLFVDQYEGLIQQRKPRWSSGVSERKKFGLMSHRRMRVQLEGTASASLPMSIDLVGKRPFEVVFSRIEGNQSNIFSTHVLFEVSLQHHSKLIRLYSTVTLTNMTSLMLEARLEIPFGIAPKIMEPILPDEVIPLPVHLAETGQIRFRPYGRDLLWSEAYSLSKLISTLRENKNIPQRPVLCYPSRPNNTLFRCTINVQEKPVYSVENPSQWNTWNFLLQAPLIIKNGLPCAMDVVITSGAGVHISTSISKGDSISVYEVDIINDLNMEFTISKYIPSRLKFARANIQQEKSETAEVLVFNPEEPSGHAVYARVQKTIDFTTGRREVYIFVQYWIYNCSGLDLIFVDCDVEETTEQVLHGTPLNKGVSISSKKQGLQSLLAANGNGLKQAGLRIDSHLPSRRVLKHSQREYSSEDISNDVEYTQEEPTPHLYSPAHTVSGFEVGEHKIRLRMFLPVDSAWTPPFLLDPPGGTSPIIIPQPDTKGAYVLSMCSMPAMGACSGRTKTITFRPRFVLANASRKDICFKQQGTDIIHHLAMGQNTHVHWTDTTRSLLLSVRYNEHGWDWSGGFALDRLGDTQLKAHNHLNGKMEILRVEVIYPDAEGGNSIDQRLGTFYIIVTNDETGFMPYRIDNFSSGRLRFYQKRCEKIENVLQPYSSCDYAWDEPCLPRQLVIEVPGEGGLGAYELENVKTYPPVQLSSSIQKFERRFVISVHAEGAKRVLSVADLSLHTQKDPKPLTLEEKLANSMVYATEKYSLNLACIGISLVDSTPQELVFASARQLNFQLAQSDREQDVKLEITGLQVDNQLRHAAFPVMLSTRSGSTRHWSTVMNNDSGSLTEKITESPTLSLVVSKWRRPMGSVDCFQCIYLSVAPLCLELEERSLIRLITFLRSVAVGGSNMGLERSTTFKVQTSKLTELTGSSMGLTGTPLTGLRFVEITDSVGHLKSWPSPAAVNPVKFPAKKLIISAKQKRKVYIEAFCIDVLELTISFSSIPWLPKERRGESILFATGSLLQRRLIALADVEGAPIRLRQLVLAHPMANWNAIFGIVQRHYTRQLLHEVYKVLGSADVFGNPMSFMRSLGSGMYDFVSAPARSIRQNPVYVVQGVRLGTKSLFRNTIFAFSNAATQMSKAARKGVAVLALDQDYLNDHEINDEGIWSRDSSIVNEFLEGLTGLLQSSVRGAERHGIPGVFSGMAVGVLRAIARPAASMLEVAGKTALSIRNSSRPIQQRTSRVRLPRHLEQGSPLLPYSWNEALGMAVLLEAENGHLKEEVYVTCQPLVEPGVFVLLTENLLIQVKYTREVMDPKWNILSKNAVEDILYIERYGETLDVLFCTYSGSKKGLTPSLTPFNNVSLQLHSSQAADELHGKLVRVISKHGNNLRQAVKLNGRLNSG